MITRFVNWLVTPIRARRDWKYGMPECPVDETAEADMQRARDAGESGSRLDIAPITEAKEGRHHA